MTIRSALVLCSLALLAVPLCAQCERQSFDIEFPSGFPPAFGAALGLSDDGRTLLVGAPKAVPGGEVHVFERLDASWTLVEVFPAPAGRAAFGHCIALSGDGRTALVGSYVQLFDTGGEVHVLERVGALWQETARLLADAGEDDEAFGASLGLSFAGERAAVSAREDDRNGTNTGGVYVFERTHSGWERDAVLVLSIPVLSERFGSPITISDSGTTILGASLGRNIGNGVAFAFERVEGVWSETAIFEGRPDALLFDFFGSSLTLSADGRTAAIGANSLTSFAGSFVEVHVRESAGWRLDERVFAAAADPANGFGFGCRLSNDGQRMLVGASTRAVTTSQDGSAALLVRGAGGWVEGPALLPSTPEVFGNFGRELVLSGDGTTAVIASQRGFVFSTPGTVFAYDLGLCSAPQELARGGVASLTIDAGVVNAGAPYWILGSFSGTDPDFSLGAGKRLALVPDAYTLALAQGAAGLVLVAGRGRLDDEGRAQASFTPPDFLFELAPKSEVFHAALVFGPSLWASNASPVKLLP